MRSIFLFSLMALLMWGCNPSQKLLNNRMYDAAIRKSVKKIKKKQKDKEVNVLKEAYRLANTENNERIAFLRKEGRPENWEEIFLIYSQMANRQTLVRTLRENILSRIGYVFVDYDQEIIASKQKAAEYLYAHALKLLEKTGDKMAARQAWEELQKVKTYYPSFKDIDSKINEARAAGMNYVIFEMKNGTPVPLPPDFEVELTKISLQELDQKWIMFDVKKVEARYYDYKILVNMKVIDVSPEGVKEVHYAEEKEVADGYEYELDANGNVKKDSLGNDIKKPKYKKISCNVVETQLHKAARISGSVDFLNLITGQLIKSEPVVSESFFDYAWANATGDLNALKPETKEKLKLKPGGFPPDFDMLFQNGQILKGMVKDIIWRNKGLFLN